MTPKKPKSIYLPLILFGILLGSYFFLRPAKLEKSAVKDTPSPELLTQKTIGEIAKQPISALPSAPDSAPVKTECQGIRSWIMQKDPDDLQKNLFSILKPEEEACFQNIEWNLEGSLNFEACKSWQKNPENKTHQENCQMFLGALREEIILETYSGVRDFKSLDLTILANMISALFVKSRSPEDQQRYFDMTRAYMERMPGQINAIKAHVSSVDPLEADSPEKRKYLESLIEHGLKIDSKDQNLKNTQLALYLKSADANEKLDNYIQSNPNDAYGYYYKAQKEWNSGNKDLAMKNIDHAKQLRPNDFLINEMYTTISKSNPKAGTTSYVHSFGFSTN